MLTHNLGYPRIGHRRQLKKAIESYWAGTSDAHALDQCARTLRHEHWLAQREAGIDLVPCNDFSLYDQMLDMSVLVDAIPERHRIVAQWGEGELAVYFAMARGYQHEGLALTALEMTKWFDTNYHYLVPEFRRRQEFRLNARKLLEEHAEACALGLAAKPVLVGPLSYLLLGKEKEPGFHRLDLLDRLLPVYAQALCELERAGAQWVQLDEPCLVTDLDAPARAAYRRAYDTLARACPGLKLLVATYFGALEDNLDLALNLPVQALHADLARAPQQLDALLDRAPAGLTLSLGVVDGRNVWKNDYERSLSLIARAVERMGTERVWLAPSCSLLHSPIDLAHEHDLPPELCDWLAFARQKLDEVVALSRLAQPKSHRDAAPLLAANLRASESRRQSQRVHRPEVAARLAAVAPDQCRRATPHAQRKQKQQEALHLPPLPTTTIGSFPQTEALRALRLRLKQGELTAEQYDAALAAEIERAIRWQEDIGIDVPVHGEFERNDMVEYFGEQLDGYAFTRHGWVQSYGTRCVKPPILYGDVQRTGPMTVRWSRYAQSLTQKPVKGMLTGPVTLLQWSFVRDDLPRETIARQLALAIRDEVADLEAAGIRIVQIDEPALREGLPLRRSQWPDYLRWAAEAFRLASSGVADTTQIHTHMCYSEFNDILEAIADLDADVITIETCRSDMELLQAFGRFDYPNDIGPGVYDIHSPRIPETAEIGTLLQRALMVVPAERLWVNPDCGLKTRGWDEVRPAIEHMVQAARSLRETLP